MVSRDIFQIKLILAVGITNEVRLDHEGNIIIEGYVYNPNMREDEKIELILELPDDKEYRREVLEALKKTIEKVMG